MVWTKCHPWQQCQNKPYDPFGVNHPPPECQRNIHKLYQGDLEIIVSDLCLVDGQTATTENSKVTFTFKDQRFTRAIIWEGGWGTGIDPTEVPGTVKITMPEAITRALRRGPFLYSVDVADTLGNHRHTCEEGTVLVEYAANAPIPDVPYRTDV
jgi:hypothetical protein